MDKDPAKRDIQVGCGKPIYNVNGKQSFATFGEWDDRCRPTEGPVSCEEAETCRRVRLPHMVPLLSSSLAFALSVVFAQPAPMFRAVEVGAASYAAGLIKPYERFQTFNWQSGHADADLSKHEFFNDTGNDHAAYLASAHEHSSGSSGGLWDSILSFGQGISSQVDTAVAVADALTTDRREPWPLINDFMGNELKRGALTAAMLALLPDSQNHDVALIGLFSEVSANFICRKINEWTRAASYDVGFFSVAELIANPGATLRGWLLGESTIYILSAFLILWGMGYLPQIAAFIATRGRSGLTALTS